MAHVETRQRLVYDIHGEMSVEHVAEALLALDALIRRTPQIFEQIFPGTTIDSVGVYLSEIRSGSLIEEIVVKFIFGDQAGLDGFINNARRSMGMDAMTARKQIFAAVLFCLIFSGAGYAVRSLMGDDEETVRIEGNNNVIIDIGAVAADMDPEDLRRIIQSAVSVADRSALAAEAIAVLRPAKIGRGSMRMEDAPGVEIHQQTIEAIPSVVMPDQPSESLEDFRNVAIEVRATDLDKNKTGWAVRVPSLFAEQRITMEVDGGIDRSRLASGTRHTGDITVLFQQRQGKEKTPRKVYLRSIADESAADGIEH